MVIPLKHPFWFLDCLPPLSTLLDFAPAGNPGEGHQEALPEADCPQNNCRF